MTSPSSSLWSLDQTIGRRVVDRAGLLVALGLGYFEGADLASMGPTLSRISKALSLDPGQAGLCASASLVGLVLGAAVGGRLADRLGRTPMLVIASVLLGVFSLATTFAWDFGSLAVLRFLAGLGMGGLLPVILAMGGDAAQPSFRATAIGMVIASGSLGGVTVGLISLLPDWRLVFVFGGLGPLVVLPLLFWLRPATRTPGSALEAAGPSLLATLFGEGRARGTLIIWAVSFCTVLASYIMINWLPSLLTLQGVDERTSRAASIVYGLGSIVGNLSSGQVTDRGRPRLAYLIGFVGAALCVTGLARLGPASAFVLIFFTAICIIGAQLVTYSLASTHYPDDGRVTGLGGTVSAGRCGSVVGPVLAGELLHRGFAADAVFLSLAPVFLLALVMGLVLASVMARRGSLALVPVGGTGSVSD